MCRQFTTTGMSKRTNISFPGGHKKAFTLSYDDGAAQDARLIKLMNKYGLKGTFNLNSGLLGQKSTLLCRGTMVEQNRFKRDRIRQIYQGHEIAAHSSHHPDLTAISQSERVEEILGDQKELERIAGYKVQGFAYPYGSYDEGVIQLLEHSPMVYARTTQSTGRFDLPENFLKWNPTCRHREDRMEELGEKFLNCRLNDTDSPILFCLWGHSYEFDIPGEWERMERFFEKIAWHRDIWYATNIQIVLALEISAEGC